MMGNGLGRVFRTTDTQAELDALLITGSFGQRAPYTSRVVMFRGGFQIEGIGYDVHLLPRANSLPTEAMEVQLGVPLLSGLQRIHLVHFADPYSEETRVDHAMSSVHVSNALFFERE
jgi:hypothetical protein